MEIELEDCENIFFPRLTLKLIDEGTRDMTITEEKLLALGFTPADLQSLHRYSVKGVLSLEMVISDLAKRFNAALLLTFFLAAVYLLTFFIASTENVISLGIAMLIALLIIWFFQPPLLSYKAWKAKRKLLQEPFSVDNKS
ncbi:hypothetical protein [uncultured Pluralibacter sp.]|uniref:hypothetical protein n=1 Tax=uncultured Pluralibacter sp. TaxID=1490864 RepID=UPI00261923E1|nr:hypothetical protein [uncultured Pluralibacter sp.]